MSEDAKKADPELLEHAANAAGYKWRWFGANFCTEHDENLGTYRPWNPLTDDGDALRLAVKLRIDVTFNEMDVFAFPPDGADGESELINVDDPNAATRLVIVRAAAALASAKPPPSLDRAVNARRERQEVTR